MSLARFLSFSEWTAFTSRSVALAVNSGLWKNCENLKTGQKYSGIKMSYRIITQ